MATALINNLYPPIMDTYMPAFDREKNCKVYFSLSSFNDREDINDYAQVQIRYQQSNTNAIDIKVCPAGIIMLPINYNEENQQYYINFSKDIMQNNKFELNVYYKIQIRFMTRELEIPKDDNGDVIQQDYSWFNNTYNISKFSEWSKICLIRGIATPNFLFNSFEVSGKSNNGIIVINNRSFSDLVGKMDFINLDSGEEESDKLKSYEVYIYKKENLENILFDSGVQYPESTNSINQKIKYLFEDECYYRIVVEILTSANYSDNLILDFFVSNQYRENDNINDECKIICNLDESEARVGIILTHIDKILSSGFDGDLVFRRSSQKSNFSYWEDIQIINNSILHQILNSGVSDFIWYDYTIESGEIYQYGVQKIIYNKNKIEKRRGLMKTNESYNVLLNLEDMFLTTYNTQLKIQLNPQISNFSKTIIENKVDTVGSKYPFFYRNANVGYKTFSISGMIHSLMDENYLFLNKNNYKIKNESAFSLNESYLSHLDEENIFIKSSLLNSYSQKENDLNRQTLYGNNYKYILEANNNELDKYEDYNYEKDFRNLVIEFLTDGKPKLFKSPTEGNILIRLMNVNFTPNQVLGRLVYSFSATAYEIDECNIDNYIKYNIHKLNYSNSYYNGEYVDNSLKKIGEIIINTKQESDIYKIIKEKNNFFKTINNKKIEYTLANIDWIDVSFPTTSPYDELGVDESSLLDNSGYSYIGHSITINEQNIIIPQYKSYYITKEDLKNNTFTSIKVEDKNKYVKIIYKVTLNKIEEEDIFDSIAQKYLKVGVGQLWGALTNDIDVIELIASNYKKETLESFLNISKIRRLYLEGTPGAYFTRIRKDKEEENYTLNSTGQLDLQYGEESLDNFTFKGFKLYSAKNPIQMHEQEFFVFDMTPVNSIKEILNPKNNYVYSIIEDNKIKKKIYYLGHWCDFELLSDTEGLAKYKAEVIIYYLYNLQKGGNQNDTK